MLVINVLEAQQMLEVNQQMLFCGWYISYTLNGQVILPTSFTQQLSHYISLLVGRRNHLWKVLQSYKDFSSSALMDNNLDPTLLVKSEPVKTWVFSNALHLPESKMSAKRWIGLYRRRSFSTCFTRIFSTFFKDPHREKAP